MLLTALWRRHVAPATVPCRGGFFRAVDHAGVRGALGKPRYSRLRARRALGIGYRVCRLNHFWRRPAEHRCFRDSASPNRGGAVPAQVRKQRDFSKGPRRAGRHSNPRNGLFSTANANAFAVHALDAVIKPNSDQPTVGQVTVVASNELLVQSVRGELACIVGGDTKLISEGKAYRVVLEANGTAEASQGPAGSGSGRPPIGAGKSHAIYLLAAAVAVPTIILLVEALE